jgi:hypothetical protein
VAPALPLAADAPSFERAVLLFPYGQDALLQAVTGAVAEVNAAAVPAGSSARSHVLTAQQVAAAEAGALDIVTGVHVIDAGRRRLMVLEGVSGPGKGMARVRAAIGRGQANTEAWRLLASSDVRFARRLYTCYGLCLKDLRLRVPLEAVCAMPALYDRQQVSEGLHGAVVALRELTRLGSLAEARALAAFPSPAGLNELEDKYGGTVSLADMHGEGHPAAHALEASAAGLRTALEATAAHVDASLDAELLLRTTALGLDRTGALKAHAAGAGAGLDGGAAGANASTLSLGAQLAAAAHAAGGATSPLQASMANPEYARTVAQRDAARSSTDFVARNVRAVDAASAQLAASRRAELAASLGPERVALLSSLRPGETLDTAGKPLPGGAVHPYSGQTLNTGDWARELQRARLAADKGAIYSYAPEYASATISLAPPASSPRAVAEAERAKWKTARGFAYPAKRSPEERLRHPDRPSDSRVADLAQRWVEPYEQEAAAAAAERAPGEALGKPRFNGNPAPHVLASGVFGFVDAGGAPRAEYWQSVHLGGDGVEAEREAREKADKEAWAAAVVVDTPRMLPYHSHDGAGRANRYQSLLRDPPAKLGLQRVHAAALPSGKPIPPDFAPPVSIALLEPALAAGRAAVAGGATGSASSRGAPLSSGGATVDWRRPAFTDSLRGDGAASLVYSPLRDAGKRAAAPVGSAVMPDTLRRGTNTDRP